MYIQNFSIHTIHTLHSVMLVGIDIATNQPRGTESSCLRVSNLQSLLEQVTRKVLLLSEFVEKPPIIACPLPNGTISWPKRGLGKVGPAKSWYFIQIGKNNWDSETYRKS